MQAGISTPVDDEQALTVRAMTLPKQHATRMALPHRMPTCMHASFARDCHDGAVAVPDVGALDVSMLVEVVDLELATGRAAEHVALRGQGEASR